MRKPRRRSWRAFSPARIGVAVLTARQAGAQRRLFVAPSGPRNRLDRYRPAHREAARLLLVSVSRARSVAAWSIGSSHHRPLTSRSPPSVKTIMEKRAPRICPILLVPEVEGKPAISEFQFALTSDITCDGLAV